MNLVMIHPVFLLRLIDRLIDCQRTDEEKEGGEEDNEEAEASGDPAGELMAAVTRELNSEGNIDHSIVELTVFPQVCGR
jgi:hypothetical protein